MTKKQTQMLSVIVLVVLIVALAWLFRNKGPASQANVPASGDQNQAKANNSAAAQIAPANNNSVGTWDGTLQKSDNAAKGNLMLVMSGRTVYLRTSRNFSSLIGKQVTASYQGTLTDFTLLNITAK